MSRLLITNESLYIPSSNPSRYFVSFLNRCENCKLKFPSKNAASRHFKDTHGKCVETNCEKSFCSQSRLDSHILKSHSKAKCLQCNEFFNKTDYGTHSKTVHPNDTAICHLCGKSFINQHTLKYHCEMVHTRSNKLQCDLCKLWYEISFFFILKYFSVYSFYLALQAKKQRYFESSFTFACSRTSTV